MVSCCLHAIEHRLTRTPAVPSIVPSSRSQSVPHGSGTPHQQKTSIRHFENYVRSYDSFTFPSCGARNDFLRPCLLTWPGKHGKGGTHESPEIMPARLVVVNCSLDCDFVVSSSFLGISPYLLLPLTPRFRSSQWCTFSRHPLLKMTTLGSG